MRPAKNICVYCGSSPGVNPVFSELATAFGASLARSEFGLVYGGGTTGLMGELGQSVVAHGGYVTGVTTDFLKEKESALAEAQELYVVSDMHTRKRSMFEYSDAFVALPGGIGTLEELVEQLTWVQLERHMKPIVLLNIRGFWDPFLELLSHMTHAGFIQHDFKHKYFVTSQVEDVLPIIRAVLKSHME